MAVSDPVNLLRACINYNDSIVTISWKSAADNCSSFSHYSIYEQQNSGLYSRIATITDLSIVEYPHKISDQNANRNYYIVTAQACNGTDSLFSDTLKVDVTYPEPQLLDSVSYDLLTQDIIAGWRKNTSRDTKRYQLYDFSSGNGDSLTTTTDTFDTISKSPAKVFPLVIAAIDSCDLSTLLSTPHRVSTLNTSIDTCKNEITLTWSKYLGWSQIDSQVVYVNINNQGFTQHTSLNESFNSLVFNDFVLGDELVFFLRSFTASGKTSSSSNTSTITTRKLSVPSVVYLNNVTVVNDNYVEIEFTVDNEQDQLNYVIERSLDGSLFNVISSMSTSYVADYFVNDNNIDVDNQAYLYKVSSVNKCFDTVAFSNVSGNILYKLKPSSSHNPYTGWNGNVSYYETQKQHGSTWNAVKMYTDDTPNYADSIGCYRTVAYEKGNALNMGNAISTSNVNCNQPSLEVEAPSALNLNSTNNRFVLIGEGIDHSTSYYQIFNRWGEKIFQAPTNQSWYAEANNEVVQNGLFTYVAMVYGVKGEKLTITGTIYVIR